MTGWRRFAVSVAAGTVLSVEAATLVCVPAGLGPNWWFTACGVFAAGWGLAGDRIVDRAVTAWKQLGKSPTIAAHDGDGPTLLALFVMHGGPVRLFDLVVVLSPYPDPPSWMHPLRRWNVMTAWVSRNDEVLAEARSLADAGLLRCTERGRRRDRMGVYEITGLGRDVAARNAEVLMAGRTEENA